MLRDAVLVQYMLLLCVCLSVPLSACYKLVFYRNRYLGYDMIG